MTAGLPDAYWCRTCRTHRTTDPAREYPVCADITRKGR